MTFLSSVSLRTKLIILILIVVPFSVAFPFLCSFTGNTFGKTVGAAVGSFQAVTEDMPAAYHQGKADGLSAADTQADLQSRMREVGRLDVLAASAQLTDPHKIGAKYSALYQIGADVVFSVDISRAEIKAGEKSIDIYLPEPEAEINVDSTRTKLEDVWQRGLFNGTAKDGIDAYMNSMETIQKSAKEAIADYNILEQKAISSAEKQVKMLAGLIAEKGTAINVYFDNGAGEKQ